MRRAFVASLLVATLLAACGGGSPSMTARGASELHAQVTAVRAAASAHDADGAARALDTLRTSVARLRRSGDVTADRATTILAAASTVEDQLVSITTTTTTTTTVPRTVPPDQGDDRKGNGNGKGRDAKG